MEVSEIRVKLVGNPTDRLKAFASVTFDGDFVVRDIKVIDGVSGIFVAMPSRKLTDRCPECGDKNHLRANYCNECGTELPKDRAQRDRLGRNKLHADIAHPINSECRRRLQELIVEAYGKETESAKEPGYRPASDEDQFEETEVAEVTEDTEDTEVTEDTEDTEVTEDTEDTEVTEDTEDTGGYDDMIADLKRDAARRRQPAAPAEQRGFADEDDDEQAEPEAAAPVEMQEETEPADQEYGEEPEPAQEQKPKYSPARAESSETGDRSSEKREEPVRKVHSPPPADDEFGAGLF